MLRGFLEGHSARHANMFEAITVSIAIMIVLAEAGLIVGTFSTPAPPAAPAGPVLAATAVGCAAIGRRRRVRRPDDRWHLRQCG